MFINAHASVYHWGDAMLRGFLNWVSHRRTGNFLPGGAVNHLPKKFSQVAQIFTKQ